MEHLVHRTQKSLRIVQAVGWAGSTSGKARYPTGIGGHKPIYRYPCARPITRQERPTCRSG